VSMSSNHWRARLKIAVIGPHECTPEEYELGRKVGAEIARAGAILVCGGLDGMMEASAAGAQAAGGLTMGILPGDKTDDANPYIDIALPTGLGAYRNALIARSADAVIAVGGHHGTLTEMAYALRFKTPVVALRSWTLLQNNKPDPEVHAAETPEEAVRLAVQLARQSR
jgi:uncharacterized protein (TIGR00725 family)